MRFGPKLDYEDGRKVPGSRGNKYFDRARELLRVKELFDELSLPRRLPKGRTRSGG